MIAACTTNCSACVGRKRLCKAQTCFTRQHGDTGLQGLLHDTLQASEDVRRTRGRVATLKGRLSSLLSSQPGEVTEQVLFSCCVAQHDSLMSAWQAVCNVRWVQTGTDHDVIIS